MRSLSDVHGLFGSSKVLGIDLSALESEPSTYERDRETVLKIFSRLPQGQAFQLVKDVVQNARPSLVQEIADSMQPLVRRDFLSLLPEEIAFRILLEMDFHSLLTAASVSRNWNRLATDDRLWRRKWDSVGWRLSRGEKHLRRKGLLSWRTAYVSRLKLERNWANGEYVAQSLVGHTDGVSCMKYADKTLVTGGHDKVLKVWDLGTGLCIRTLEGHDHYITSVQLTPRSQFGPDDQGAVAYSSSWDGTIIAWSLGTGEQIARTRPSDMNIPVLTLSLKGRCLVAGLMTGSLVVYDTDGLRQTRTIRAHNVAVNSTDLDANWLVAGAADGEIAVMTARTGANHRRLSGHRAAVTSIVLQSKYGRCLSGSCDQTIRVWNIETGEAFMVLNGHTAAIHSISVEHDRLVSASGNGTLMIWDLHGGQRMHTIDEHRAYVSGVQCDCYHIVSCSGDRTIKVLHFAPDAPSWAPGSHRPRARRVSSHCRISIQPIV
eukprot:Clim_evm32s156 gene=Clim_evmTU32s156